MLLLCDKCNVQGECKLNRETNEVICTQCGGVVANVTEQMKQAMRSNKDFIEEDKPAFAFFCPSCQKRQPCVVRRDGQAVICRVCKTEIENISPFFRATMKNLGIYE